MSKKILILFSIILMFSTIACNSTPKKSRQPVSSIMISSEKPKIGENLQINIAVDPKNGKLQKTDLYLDNELIYSSNELKFTYKINNLKSFGIHQIKIIATKTDGIEGINFKNFNVISNTSPKELNFNIVKTYPHNSNFFTQGFEIIKGEFYEGTGTNGSSAIYQYDLNSGRIIRKLSLEEKYFGEGITILNNKIYQLTYKAQKAFVYNFDNFARIDSFSYETPEGWGLTNDGELLIKSSGSEYIDFIDPTSFKVVKSIVVCDNYGAVKNINELEYYNGIIYANVWLTNTILKIDAKTGQVLAKCDLSKLYTYLGNVSDVDVLNGIAIDKLNGRFFVTGKYWDKIFEIKLND